MSDLVLVGGFCALFSLSFIFTLLVAMPAPEEHQKKRNANKLL